MRKIIINDIAEKRKKISRFLLMRTPVWQKFICFHVFRIEKKTQPQKNIKIAST